MDQNWQTTIQRWRRRLLDRGESAIAWFGIVLAATSLLSMLAFGWWMHRVRRDTLADSHQKNLQTVGQLLSDCTESLLTTNELSLLRRFVTDIAREQNLNVCRVMLPDGGVIADARPSAITVIDLPEQWPSSINPEPVVAPAGAPQIARYELQVPGRGWVILEMAGRDRQSPTATGTDQVVVGVIGVSTFAILLVVYHLMRCRFRAIGAVREALLSLQHQSTSETALLVSQQLGDEAVAWNDLIADRMMLKRELTREKALDALETGGAGNAILEAACDTLPLGLLIVDSTMRVRYANGAASILLRLEHDHLTGQELSGLIDHENLIEATKAVIDELARGKAKVVELAIGHSTSSSVVRLEVRPVQRNGQTLAIIVAADITQQRRTDEARDAFLTQATHELRAPLTNIRLYVESAIDGGDQDPKMREQCLNVINQESRRLERIVSDMLSVSEIEAGAMTVASDEIRLDRVLADLESHYTPQAQENSLRLRFTLPPKLPILVGDRDKIVLALHNLLSNALKYTEAGGEVEVIAEEQSGHLHIMFRDTGFGIGEQDLQRIFEKFQRSKDERLTSIKGSGLGLTLAREIVRLHGGDIEVESELNEGSVFTVILPVTVPTEV